jgi:hypothetical protein
MTLTTFQGPYYLSQGKAVLPYLKIRGGPLPGPPLAVAKGPRPGPYLSMALCEPLALLCLTHIPQGREILHGLQGLQFHIVSHLALGVHEIFKL